MDALVRKSAAGIFFLLFGCSSDPSPPELQAPLADSLVQVGTSGVFVSALKSVGSKPSPVGAVLPCVKTCATTRSMWVQVTYPVTVCFPPDFSAGNIMTLYREGKQPDTLAAIIASKTPVAHQVSRRVGLHERLFCKTHGGPWYAEIVDQEQCSAACGPGEHRWVMVILGVEQTLSWEWWGTLADRPQQVEFIGEPWLRSQTLVDCDPTDPTECKQ